MEITDKRQVLDNFIQGQYEQIFCEKCMNTFLTNVYNFSEDYVLLEKRSLGLEYFCNAIHARKLSRFPDVVRIGVLDEEDHIIHVSDKEELFRTEETDYRYLYVMEKMEHLSEEECLLFDTYVKDMEWMDDAEREAGLQKIAEAYDGELRHDIEQLFEYYLQHQEYVLWDLHGDNLMRRLPDKQLVILDPFAIKV